jgi:hypothetical protein
MKYRKKPVIIEAIQYAGNGNNYPINGKRGTTDWLMEAFFKGILTPTNGSDPLYINTLEGKMLVSPDDWIIKGVKGELYPCKPDIFEATYEKVD